MKFSLVLISLLFMKLLSVKISRECKCTTLHLTADAPARDCIGQKNTTQQERFFKNGKIQLWIATLKLC